MRSSLLCTAALLATTSVASADIILGNYPPPNDGTLTATVNNLRRKAIAFAMPAGLGYNITSITLRLGNYDPADLAFLEIRDHNGTSTSPGAGIVGTFTAPVGLGPAIGDYVFTPNGTITLNAGTSYWIYLHGGATPSAFDWRAASPGVTPTGIATYGPGNLFTTNSGSTWTTSATINSFNIEGVVVPAPAAAGLLMFAGVAAARRRR